MSFNELCLKICVIGTPDQLKNQFIRSYAGYKLESYCSQALGVDILVKHLELDKTRIKLIITDIVSQEYCSHLRKTYYIGTAGAIITFSKANKKSFYDVNDWLIEFRDCYRAENIPIALMGFITDSNEVSIEMGQCLADRLNLDYYETTVTNVQIANQVFTHLCQKILFENELDIFL